MDMMTSHLSSYDQTDLNLTATLELTLALPGSTGTTTSINDNKLPPAAAAAANYKDTRNINNKRSFPAPHIDDDGYYDGDIDDYSLLAPPASKAAVAGWPPIPSYMKNNILLQRILRGESGTYVKVSMDGVPYLRKIDLKLFNSYTELFKALENMFKLTLGEYSETEGYNGLISEFAPTYQDKDGDWMLLGDVPWEMFIATRKRRLRMMKGAIRN